MLRWLKASRVQFLTATLVPVLVGTGGAFRELGIVNWKIFSLALLAMALIHLGVNLANDYFDHLSGADDINPAPLSPLAGGSRAIQEGLLTPRAVLVGAVSLLGLGALLGVVLIALSGPLLLLIGAFGVLTGYFYTAPPLRFSYRGLGEICVALDFGFLPALGAFYIQTGELSLGALLASLPVAFLITAVLWVNEIPDIPYDRAAGKWTLPARLGPRRAALGLGLLFAGASLSFLAPLLLWREPILLLPLASSPAAFLALLLTLRNYSNPAQIGGACKFTILAHFAGGLLLSLVLFLAG